MRSCCLFQGKCDSMETSLHSVNLFNIFRHFIFTHRFPLKEWLFFISKVTCKQKQKLRCTSWADLIKTNKIMWRQMSYWPLISTCNVFISLMAAMKVEQLDTGIRRSYTWEGHAVCWFIVPKAFFNSWWKNSLKGRKQSYWRNKALWDALSCALSAACLVGLSPLLSLGVSMNILPRLTFMLLVVYIVPAYPNTH